MYENGNEQKKTRENNNNKNERIWLRSSIYIYLYTFNTQATREMQFFGLIFFHSWVVCEFTTRTVFHCVSVYCVGKFKVILRCVLFLSRFISFSVSLWLCVFNQQVTSASRSVSQWVSDAMRPMIMMMNRFYSMTNLSLLLYFVFVLSWHFSNTFLVFIHNYTLYTCRYSDTSFFSILTLSVIHLKFITMWESLDLHDGIRNDCTLNSF